METQNNDLAKYPGVINLRLREISQLFNTLDPSAFRIRDLSPSVDQYLVDWAQELPQGSPLRVVVYLGSGGDKENEVENISDALGSRYSEKERAETHALRILFRDGRRAFLIGMSLLSACLFIAWRLSQDYQGPFAHLIQESFVIIGWVVIWRPVEIFLYDWIPLVRRRKLYHRLAAAKVTAVSATSAL
jgi:hypothetical protein